MPTSFITGANRGIGLEFARQYAAAGWTVHGSVRNLDQTDALSAIPCLKGGSITIHKMDVTNHEQIYNVSRTLKDESIDVLINNAGMWIGDQERFGQFTNDDWMDQFRCHVFGTMAMCQAFVDQVASSGGKSIVNISSGNGCFGWPRSAGDYPYDSSKAALNLLTKGLSTDLRHLGITVISLTPGYVATDMSGPHADLQPSESVHGMRLIINNLTPKLSGLFMRYNGENMPW